MNIQILLFDGFDELDVIAPFEVFRMATSQGADLRARLVTLERAREVLTAHGLRVKSEGPLEASVLDLLLVPGGGWNERCPQGAWTEAKRGVLPEAVAKIHAAGKTVASVCTGAMLLASAGLMKGRPCTTHHLAMEELRATGAKVIEARVVDDGDLITSAGVTSGLDLALYLVERFANAPLAKKIEGLLEYSRQGLVQKP